MFFLLWLGGLLHEFTEFLPSFSTPIPLVAEGHNMQQAIQKWEEDVAWQKGKKQVVRSIIALCNFAVVGYFFPLEIRDENRMRGGYCAGESDFFCSIWLLSAVNVNLLSILFFLRVMLDPF